MKHILHVFATFCVGGPQVRVCDRLNFLGNDYRHTIIAMDNNFACKERLIGKKINIRFLSIQYEKKNLLKRMIYFRNVLSELQPDIMITYNWGSIEWVMSNAIMPVCPSIHSEYGFGPEEQKKQKWRRVITRFFFLKTVKKLVVPSLNLKKNAIDKWRIFPGKIKYIPNGVDTTKFRCMHLPIADRHDDDLVVIGTVAALRQEKNLKRMLDMFAFCSKKVKNIKLRIVGDGKERKRLIDHAEKLGIIDQVDFFGSTDRPEKLLNTFDIFAMTSDTEQMPNSLLEAMACGLPVVSTDVGDIYYMVGELNKPYVYPTGSLEKMVNGGIQLIKDEDLRKKIGKCNQERCLKHFNRELSNISYKRLYDKIIY